MYGGIFFMFWILHQSIKQTQFYTLALLQYALVFSLLLWGVAFAQETVNSDHHNYSEMIQKMNAWDQQYQNRLNLMETRMNTKIETVTNRFDERLQAIDYRFKQLEELFKQIDKRFEQQIHMMYILAMIFTLMMIAVLAFCVWDRRSFFEKSKEIALKETELLTSTLDKKIGDNNQMIKKIYAFQDHMAKKYPEYKQSLMEMDLVTDG